MTNFIERLEAFVAAYSDPIEGAFLASVQTSHGFVGLSLADLRQLVKSKI